MIELAIVVPAFILTWWTARYLGSDLPWSILFFSFGIYYSVRIIRVFLKLHRKQEAVLGIWAVGAPDIFSSKKQPGHFKFALIMHIIGTLVILSVSFILTINL